jgi:hypothetical protein
MLAPHEGSTSRPMPPATAMACPQLEGERIPALPPRDGVLVLNGRGQRVMFLK